MQTGAVSIHNLTLTHHRHPVVHHLSGVVRQGSLTAIVGPNGAGKSSLLEALVGRLPPTTGEVTYAKELRGNIGYLPQQAQIDRSFPLRVLEVVQMGAWRSLRSWRGAMPEQRRQALAALDVVGLAHFENRLMGELSVGQFQRVLFARLLVQDAQVILLDEPFNAIDAQTSDDLLSVVKQWHAQGRTVVAVLHDLAQVRAHFPQTLLLAREAIDWGATESVLTPDNLARARQVASHWDENAAPCDRPAPVDHNTNS